MHNGKYLLAVRTGAGIMDFPAILFRAKANGYSGYLSVEYAPRGEECRHHPILAAVPAAQRETMRYVLDQDPSDTDMLADHAASIRYLNGLMK